MTMLKPLMIAATLGLGTAAIAQTTQPTGTTGTNTTQPTGTTGTTGTMDTTGTGTMQPTGTAQPSGQTVDDPSEATGPEGMTQQGTDPNGQATAPAGTNMGVQGTGMGPAMPMANQGAAFTPRPAAGEYPPCSRTVTDSCVQTYERGVSRPRRRR